ncbi:MAG: cation diffusion facilitator family transporter [Enterobacterales bacterium]|nr:cation diffusion facilitator family transporter [Enterobacterales bacterium]
MSQANSVKSIIFALTANFLIAIAKFTAAYITKSGSMLAEAIHSLVDTSNQLLLLLGLNRSKQPASEEHPLGQGKSIYFWSFIVALILFSLGGVYAIYEGIHKLESPQPIEAPFIAIGVLLFSIVAEGFSLWGCIREVNKVRVGRSFIQWFKDSRQSELLVVFGEDVAALFGLVFALIAIALTMITGDPIFDAIGTIVIGSLLVFIAIFLGKEVKALLIGQGVEPHIKKQMLQQLMQQKTIDKVFNFLSLQMGDDVMVAVKVKMTENVSASQLIDDINACESEFKQAYPQVKWLFFEPDHRD